MDIHFDTLIQQAWGEAKRYHHKYIRAEHLLLALSQNEDMMLNNCKIDMACIRSSVGMLHCPTCDAEESMELSRSAERAWALVQSYAVDKPLTFPHILLGILQSSITVQRLFASCGVHVPDIIADLESMIEDGE